MGDYASKGLANGVGIPALVLGSLGFLQSGGLGGIFGGNQSAMACAMGNSAVAVLAEKDAEIGQLKAEKYTNDQVAQTYIALNSEIGKVNERVSDLALSNEKRFGAIDTYKVDIHRKQHELEDLQMQAQVSGFDETKCGYDTNKEILKIDTDAYNNANDIVDTQSMSTYDYNLQNVIENKIVQMLKQ